MNAPPSLRSRLVLGALLWTAGLIAAANVLATLLLVHYPSIHLVAHWTALTIFAAICLLGGLAQMRRGLSPFTQLRERLNAVRDGRIRQVDGAYPAEVQPLVTDLNALLDHRERVVQRALTTAADLAHGLKTPLAVLAQEAERADAGGDHELAATIAQQVERMRRQVDYHLAHARAAASGATPGARCALADSVEPLCRTLLRLHADRGLAFEVHVAPGDAVRGERADLDEMLGNLLDNACKWARARIVVRSAVADGRVSITVDDDGPGLAEAMRDAVLQRGVRADETAPGSGLGLAIVRDLAGLYGGTIALDRSPLGGLRARLDLPAG